MRYPALDVRHGDSGLVLAVVDDHSPTAVEERDGVLTIFFSDRPRRDHARDAIAHAWPLTVTTPREVDDERPGEVDHLQCREAQAGRRMVACPEAHGGHDHDGEGSGSRERGLGSRKEGNSPDSDGLQVQLRSARPVFIVDLARRGDRQRPCVRNRVRSEEHTSELQSQR